MKWPASILSSGLLIRYSLKLCLLMLISSTASAQHERAPDREQGEAVYRYWCSPCHDAGRGHPGTESLQIKYGGDLPAVLEERQDLTADLVRTFVREGILSMAPFRKTEISDAELDDLAAFLAGQKN